VVSGVPGKFLGDQMSPRAVIRSETKVLVKTWGLNPLEPVGFLRHLRTSYMVWSLMRLLIGLPFLRIGQKSGPGSSPRLEIQPFMARQHRRSHGRPSGCCSVGVAETLIRLIRKFRTSQKRQKANFIY